MEKKEINPTKPSKIPHENVFHAFRLYQEMKKVKVSSHEETNYNIEVEQITKYMWQLERRGFLKKERVKDLLGFVLHAIFESDKGLLNLVNKYSFLHQFSISKRGAPINIPLDIFIFILVRDSIQYTGRKNFTPVAQLLKQKTQIVLSEDSVRQRYNRMADGFITMHVVPYYAYINDGFDSFLRQTSSICPEGILKKILIRLYGFPKNSDEHRAAMTAYQAAVDAETTLNTNALTAPPDESLRFYLEMYRI